MKKIIHLFILFAPIWLFVACGDTDLPTRTFVFYHGYYEAERMDCAGGNHNQLIGYGYTRVPLAGEKVEEPQFQVECSASWIKDPKVIIVDEDKIRLSCTMDMNTSIEMRDAMAYITELTTGERTSLEIEQVGVQVYRQARHIYFESTGNKYIIALSDNGWGEDGEDKANSWYAVVTYYSKQYNDQSPTDISKYPDGDYEYSRSGNYGTFTLNFYTTNSYGGIASSIVGVNYARFSKHGSDIRIVVDNNSSYNYDSNDYLITY